MSTTPLHKVDIGVGFDVGTTFCSYAFCQGQTTPVPGKFAGEGSQMQSAVFVAEDGTHIIGRAARHASYKDPKRLHTHFKRGIPTQPFAPWNGGLTPVECTTAILKEMWKHARQACPAIKEYIAELGGRRNREKLRLSITHPAAGWKVSEQQALQAAADGVGDGFRVDAFFAEPVAGTSWYRQHQNGQLKHDHLLAVLDLGGGTFDIAVLRLQNGAFNEELVGGNGALGGLNFTGVLYQHLCKALNHVALALCFDAVTGLNLTAEQLSDADRRLAGMIWDKSEKLKLALSAHDNAQVYLETSSGIQEVELTRAAFLDLCQQGPQGDLFAAFEKTVAAALENSPLHWGDIEHVVLIGGSALLPTLIERTATVTNRSPADVHVSSDSEHVVSAGAAYYAYAGERTAQVLPGGLGLRVRQGSNHVYKMFFEPGQVISGSGETVEKLGQFIDAAGNRSTLALHFAEAKPAAQLRHSADGAYLPESEVIPIHSLQVPLDLPAGTFEAQSASTTFSAVSPTGSPYLPAPRWKSSPALFSMARRHCRRPNRRLHMRW